MATVFDNVKATFQNLTLSQSSRAWDLSLLKGFPYQTWMDQAQRYVELERWYNGEPLLETIRDTTTGQSIERFPIKINPLRGTAQKHVAVLFGTATEESIRFGTIPVRFVPDVKKGAKKQGDAIKQALLDVFEENQGGALFQQNGLVSQYLGGCVFWASWRPDRKKIEISAPSPKEVLLIPDGPDFWHYREAWLVRPIEWTEVMAFGLTEEDAAIYGGSGPTSLYYYIEHWTPDHYTVQINDTILTFQKQQMDMGNPFGFVPCVYIPHIRDKNQLLGSPIINEAVKGLIREINLRYADIGDAVSDDSHTTLFGRNIRGSLKALRPEGSDRAIIDLGSVTGIGSSEANPDAFAVNTGSLSDVMMKFAGDLISLYRVETSHPAVADGVDEGSQRSAQTLTTRMWPLVSHAEGERMLWTVGLTVFAKLLLSMMAIKGLNGITQDHLKIRLILEWTTMLPRDRDALVNEIAVRAANKVGSKKHLIEMAGDVSDPDEELSQMRDELDLEQKAAGFGQSPTGSAPPGAKNPQGAPAKKGTSPGSAVPKSEG